MVKNNLDFAARITGVIAVALLLSTTAFAADRISTQGTIDSISRAGDQYRIVLDHGTYTYYVPMSSVGARDLRVGSNVRISGLVAPNDVVNVDMLALPGEAYYITDPHYTALPYGTNGWMTGIVQRVDRHLGYLTLREDVSGQVFKIDVRHMNLRKPVNVWGVRAGDRIAVNGSWEKADVFDAKRIEY